jgi:hypothetical protein
VITLISLLKKQMDSAWALVVRAMEDVDDEMLHWKPAPGCWGLRLVNGLWQLDYHVPEPIPPGPKTIGWLAGHLATVKERHYNLCFESGDKDWGDLVIPGDAEGLRGYLARAHRPLRDALDHLEDADLMRNIPARTDEGEELALWQGLWFDIYHDIEHGGQIFQIKNEYRNRLLSE